MLSISPPTIIVSEAPATMGGHGPREVGLKPHRSSILRRIRRIRKESPPAGGLPFNGPVSRDEPSSRSHPPAAFSKRKEAASPRPLKRKFMRQVRLGPLLQLSPVKKGAAREHEPAAASPSAFEEELADQENKSPNDPEFVRRASARWQRRTGAVHLTPLQAVPQAGGGILLVPAKQPTFQWPSSPSQQPSLGRRVSPRPVHYGHTPFRSAPASPVLGASIFQRCSSQYSSLSAAPTGLYLHRASRSYSSFTSSGRRSQETLAAAGHRSSSRSPRPSRQRIRSVRTGLPGGGGGGGGGPQGGTGVVSGGMAFDDTVAEAVKRVAQQEQLLDGLSGKPRASPLRRLSIRLRRSLRNSKLLRNNSNTSNDSGHQDSASATSSTSYQSFLSASSGYSSACSSSPSSPAVLPRRLCSPPLPNPAAAAAALTGCLTFNDIFLEEPKIAQKFAIMFPTEPRPEWHRHLRQVINKAGQRIFKKGEPHDTTIPDNLRHQLKHIYVY